MFFKNWGRWKKELIVLLVYILITILILKPYLPINKIHNSIETGDTKLNAWIMAWETHILLKDPSNYAEANIFYPFKKSFFFNEHLIGISIFALPINLLFRNPILAYNLLLYLSFILSSFFMYLLVYYYTKNRLASFTAGAVYGFCTIRFAGIWHLQFISVQWWPLVFLYFHKFLESRKIKDAVGMSLFFLIQALTSWYHAFFLIISFGFLSLYFLILKRKKIDKTFWRKGSIFLITLLIIGAIAWPYYKFNQEQKIERDIQEVIFYSNNLKNFFKKEDKIEKNRGYLGLPLILAILAFLNLKGNNQKTKERIGGRSERKWNQKKLIIFYLLLFLLGVVISLGPYLKIGERVTGIKLPYYFIYNFLTPIRFIRVISRASIISLFATSVLTGLTIKKIGDFFKNYKLRFFLVFCLIFLFLLDYSSVVPRKEVEPVKIPPVYYWLKEQKGNSLIEIPTYIYPLESNNYHYETDYMLYSTIHWKHLVNGYGGAYPKIKIGINQYSKEEFMHLALLKVDFIIIHKEKLLEKDWEKLKEIMKDEEFKQYYQLIGKIGTDYVLKWKK